MNAIINRLLQRQFLACGCAIAVMSGTIGVAGAKGATALYAFKGGNGGAYPQAVLVEDQQGNFYGTTEGELDYAGTVFKLAPGGRETVLHRFYGNVSDGVRPLAGVILDAAGNPYGTTSQGGSTECQNAGCGTVFKLAPDGTETLLYVFRGADDGANPVDPLIMDKKGNLFGTTEYAGSEGCTSQGCGSVFEITAKGRFVTLHDFQQSEKDGANPVSPLIFGKNGALLGTTLAGGTINDGTVFEIAKDGTFSLRYSFQGPPNAYIPYGGLLAGPKGNLYGTTEEGGQNGYGAIYKLAPDGTETVLHSFTLGADGGTPLSALVADTSGNFYGTASNGGGNHCYTGSCGTAFRLSSAGAFAVISDFTQRAGFHPATGLMFGADGNLYGTAQEGGQHCMPSGCGTIFELKP
jgi:uncharacterized repeat protein (TIGR03803 family)